MAPSGCPGVSGVGTSYLGVALEDGNAYALPATVSIDTANIGGPSAGLAMTLTLIDKLSRKSISGNQPIAATGTIDVHGNVGDVGGVAEKTVAVQRAGAKYFFVPQVEVKTAKSEAQPGLTIVGVTTLAQALRDLRATRRSRPATPYAASLSHFRQSRRRSLEGMDDRRILSTTRQSSAEIARMNFTTLRKGGYDPNEVRIHLESVAREWATSRPRIRELQDQLSEAQRRAANPTLDEATLPAPSAPRARRSCDRPTKRPAA